MNNQFRGQYAGDRRYNDFNRRDDRRDFGRRDDRSLASSTFQPFHQTKHYQPPSNQYQGRDQRGGYRGGFKSGEKRNSSGSLPSHHGKQRDRKPNQSKPREDKKEEELVDISSIVVADEDVVITDELMENVEKLKGRETVERNTADEDIGKLLAFSFTGSKYHCATCNIDLSKDSAFEAHLKSKQHAMSVLNARDGTGEKYKPIRDILNIEIGDDWFNNSELAQTILKAQAKQKILAEKIKEAREAAIYNRKPSNFITCERDVLKLAKKEGDKVTITTLIESAITVNDFTGERFFGCEFVKAEAIYNCRICDVTLKEASHVVPHVDSKQHRRVYQNFLKKNADHEKKQLVQNKELADNLAVDEGKLVLLHEPATRHFIAKCAADCSMSLVIKAKEAAAKKEAERKAAEEKKAEEARIAAEEKAAAEAKAAEEKAAAEAKAAEEKAAAEAKAAEEKAAADAAMETDGEKVEDDKEEAEKEEADQKEEPTTGDKDVEMKEAGADDAEAEGNDDKATEKKTAPKTKTAAKSTPKSRKAKAKEADVAENKDADAKVEPEKEEGSDGTSSWVDEY